MVWGVTSGESETAEIHGHGAALSQVRDCAPAAGQLRACWHWRREFPGQEQQLAALRRWLQSLLPDCAERDDLACVATELGANAIRHTASGRGGRFAVEITCRRSVVRVAVADGGAPGGPRVIDDPDGENGRGLLVVQGLSLRSGVLGDQRGRLVWADVAWETALAVPATSMGNAAARNCEVVNGAAGFG
jgi:hypothetical protein